MSVPRLPRLLAALCLLALLGLLGSACALAAPPAAVFSIAPVSGQPYFVLHAHPGQLLQGSARVTNVGQVAGAVRLYAVDAATGQTSGAVYLPIGAPRRGVGRWISLQSSELTLNPRASEIVSFTVRVPGNAGAGQQLGGLVAAPVLPIQRNASRRGRRTFRVEVREISVVAVLVDLSGPAVQRIKITGVSASGRPGYQILVIGLGNDGDELVKGRGSLAVSTPSGRRVLTRRFALDTFVPHSEIGYPVYVSGRRLPAGSYRATVSITYGADHRLTRSFRFRISKRQLRHTYGTVAPAALGGSGSGSGSGTPAWVLALGALLILLVGAGGTILLLRARSGSGTRR
jgi:hypothetical protein